jgi:hypothetical protein
MAPTPQIETKLERVAEAFEDLAVSINLATRPDANHATYMGVVEARENLKDALRDFLQPSLRLVL